MFAGLVDVDPSTLRLVPAIAERWSSSADGRTFTFHLRTGVGFQRGLGAVTAATFVRDWSLLCNPEVDAAHAWVLAPVQGYDRCRHGAARSERRARARPADAGGAAERAVPAVRDHAGRPRHLGVPASAERERGRPRSVRGLAGRRRPLPDRQLDAPRHRPRARPVRGRAGARAVSRLLRAPGRCSTASTCRWSTPATRPPPSRATGRASWTCSRWRRRWSTPCAPIPRFSRQLVGYPQLQLVALQPAPGRELGEQLTVARAIDPSTVATQAFGKAGQAADGLVPAGTPGYVPATAPPLPAGGNAAGGAVGDRRHPRTTRPAADRRRGGDQPAPGRYPRPVAAAGDYRLADVRAPYPAADAFLAQLAGPPRRCCWPSRPARPPTRSGAGAAAAGRAAAAAARGGGAAHLRRAAAAGGAAGAGLRR